MKIGVIIGAILLLIGCALLTITGTLMIMIISMGGLSEDIPRILANLLFLSGIGGVIVMLSGFFTLALSE